MERINSQALIERVRGCRLLATDIMLIHTKRSLWGWLIRLGTHCYWNHALMVCSNGDGEQDYRNMLVVDAKTDGTIIMSRVSEYLGKRDKYDVAVKRLEASWFHNKTKTSTEELRRCICDIAINEVNFTLGVRLVRALNQLIRQFTVVFRFIRRKIRGVQTSSDLSWSIRPAQVKAFTCGGFVQWCYYKAVSKMLEEKGGEHSLLDDVVFNPRVKQDPTPFELLTTTPADLANCDKLSWKYVIKNGVIKEFPSSHEARLFTMSA